MRKSAGAKLTNDVHRVRVLLAVAVAPPYLYYSLMVARNPYSVITAVCAAALVASQYLRGKSWNEFLTPVAGCLLNASAICTTSFERSPFLFLVLIPLLTYSTERNAVWVFRSVMLNTVIMVFLALRSFLQADWFALFSVLGITGISHIACWHIRRSKGTFASVVASTLREARIDPLTRLYNRRALQEEVARLITIREPFALVLCDIDHFKLYNDTHGHLAGDRVLRRIARVLLRPLSPRGMAFRWGGDEFVLVLPMADHLMVDSVCSRIIQLIENEVEELGMSFGVAMFPHDGTSLEELLSTADRMLYGAKQHLLPTDMSQATNDGKRNPA